MALDYDQVWQQIEQLPRGEQEALLAHLQQKLAGEDDWALAGDQLIFMMQHHNAIVEAIARDDDTYFRDLAVSDAFTSVFGEMGWDEAFDRYEESLIERGDQTE